MKHSLPLLVLCFLLSTTITKAQLPDGSIAPDWTLSDIDGNPYQLYSLLDQGKMVVIEFSATWCGPCWNYMMTGALETFWNEHGPNGTDEAQVFYIEADQSTGMLDLLGLTPSSQGNWVEAIPFPIIDLQVGENTDIEYQIQYYPTLFAVCADHKLYELGQVPASEWAEFIMSCGLEASVSDVQASTCYGEGSATVEVVGGVNPISYDWSNGDNGPVLQNVGAGNYSCTVTEGNGKDVVLEDIIITGADAPIALADSEVEDAVCFASPTGSVSIQLEEGTAPYSYDWSNGSHAQNLVNVTAGSYTLTAEDNNGCPFEATFEVNEPEELLAIYEVTPEYCEQENGTVVLDIEGGVGNYDISASEGTVFGNTILDIPAGNVLVTIEDGNGCIWDDNINIEFAPAPDMYFTPDPAISCLQPTTNITGYVQNGSSDYAYSWSTSNGHIVGPTNLATITVDQEGDYNLEVSDIFTGCQVEDAVAVASTVNPPSVGAGEDAPITCENLQLDLQGVGDPSYTISWTTTDGHIQGGENTYTPTVDAAGLYIISVTNPVNGCSNIDSVIVINQLNPASAGYQYQTNGLTMIGTDVSLGSGLSGWVWTFGDGNTSNEQNTIHTYTNPGVYQVCLSVQNGCGVSQSCQTLEVTSTTSVLNVVSDIQNVLCFGDSTGSIDLQVIGGSGNYTYVWTGPNGVTYSTPSIENIVAGEYQLVVSDDLGNIFIGEFTVTEPTPIILNGSTVVDNLCFGQSNGSISLDVTGGVGPFTYSFNGGPIQAENFINNLPGGNIECLVADANGCAFLAGPYTIQEPAEIDYLSTIANVRCNGESNGSVSLNISGGVNPYSYLWNVGGFTTPDIIQLSSGQYTCAVTDHNGCAREIIVDVTQPDILQVQNLQVVHASGPQHDNGSISLEVVGGTAPYTVSWSNGATGNSIQGLVPGEYTYSVIDANGCALGVSAPITINASTSTTPVNWAKLISIAPNPSKGNVVVKWEGLEFQHGTITLATLEGKRIQSRSIASVTGHWDLTGLGLQHGVYIVLFELDNESVPYKLIIL